MGAKISINDLRKLVREEVEKQMSEEQAINEAKKKKSDVVKEDKTEENFKEVEKNAKESGAEDPKTVAIAATWKTTKKD